MERCPRRWQEECPNRNSKLGCHLVNHHLAYPSTKYKTPLEAVYRELPINKVLMCRFVENELHKADPNGPPVPSVETMQYCVDREIERRRLGESHP